MGPVAKHVAIRLGRKLFFAYKLPFWSHTLRTPCFFERKPAHTQRLHTCQFFSGLDRSGPVRSGAIWIGPLRTGPGSGPVRIGPVSGPVRSGLDRTRWSAHTLARIPKVPCIRQTRMVWTGPDRSELVRTGPDRSGPQGARTPSRAYPLGGRALYAMSWRFAMYFLLYCFPVLRPGDPAGFRRESV